MPWRGPCVMTAVQSDSCMEDGREEGMCEVVRPGPCPRWREETGCCPG